MNYHRLSTAFSILVLTACNRSDAPPEYVGSTSCSECHEEVVDAWRGSHHDLAMQEATAATVLGDFENATFEYAGVTSTFFSRDGEYWVQTDGPDGNLADYRVRYTFGVTPLQQYLLEYPGGRLQALAISWDTRPAEEGGQRWFHSYVDSTITHADPRHWTGRLLNWNWGCASCHSTNLVKGYDAASDSYNTTWTDIDVGCEACHGPASTHLDWAASGASASADEGGGGAGLVRLVDDAGGWVRHPDSATASPPASRPNRTEVETCAPCHSRRRMLAEGARPGEPLLDAFLPRPLSEGLYFADGQIDDEVYVYGSFVQSRMYHIGVTCSDCHDPHTLALKAPGNAVCAQCHQPAVYDTESHHFHPEASSGASCVNCHMPTRPYMVIDPRLDHSMRIPRPDLAARLGTPDACSGCHEDKNPAWAEGTLAGWYGESAAPVHYGETFAAARAGSAPGAPAAIALTGSREAPAIARATALDLLGAYPGQASVGAAVKALDDGDPLVRVHALGVLEMMPPADRYQFAEHRLRDSVLAVRAEAGRVLAGTPPDRLSAVQRAILDSAVGEYLAIETLHAEQPSSWVNIGLLEQSRGRFPEAESAYRTAIRLDPWWTPAYVNLADAYRREGRDAEGEQVLRDGLAAVDEPAGLHHALGLYFIRAQRVEEAMVELRLAAILVPEQARFVYVYGVALDNTGDIDGAVEVLEGGLERHPNDTPMLFALATIHRDRGELVAATRYARRLVEIDPEGEQAQGLLAQLEMMARE